jgi:hypothetical protein
MFTTFVIFKCPRLSSITESAHDQRLEQLHTLACRQLVIVQQVVPVLRKCLLRNPNSPPCFFPVVRAMVDAAAQMSIVPNCPDFAGASFSHNQDGILSGRSKILDAHLLGATALKNQKHLCFPW